MSSPQAPTQSGPTTPKAKPRRRRRLLVVFIVLAALLYGAVIALYASSGRATSYQSTPAEPKPGGVTVFLTARSVTAAQERISMDMQIKPSETFESDDGITINKTIFVIIAPVDGEQSVEFPKGQIPSSTNVDISANGAVENWPFDRYKADLIVLAYTLDSKGAKEAIPTDVHMSGYVSGWNIKAHTDRSQPLTVTNDDGKKQEVPTIDLVAWRSGSTLAFGVVLLGLLIVMPTLVLIVAITAYRGRLKVEASFMSWMGAMLFATIPLRTFLPGSPPIGSWIDFLIVLWVIVALIVGLAIYVAAWRRWGTPGARAKPAREDAPPD